MRSTILTIIALLGFASSVLADASYKIRMSCWGAFSWRYKAATSVKRTAATSGSTRLIADGSWSDYSCNRDMENEKYGYTISDQAVFTSAYAKASAGPNLPEYAKTWIASGAKRNFSAGKVADFLLSEFSYAPMYEGTEKEYMNMEGAIADIGTADIDFDASSQSILLHDLNIRVGVDDPDMANTYATVKIWILDASSAANEEDAPVIAVLQAFVFNGELVLEGSWNASEFSKEEGKSVFTLRANKVIPIGSSVSPDDIIVKVGSDAGNLGDGTPQEYAIDFKANKQVQDIVHNLKRNMRFKFFLLSNPAVDNLKFTIANGTRSFEHVTINIVTRNGRVVKQVYDGVVTDHNQLVQADIAGLAPGYYYLTATTNTSERFVQKFINSKRLR